MRNSKQPHSTWIMAVVTVPLIGTAWADPPRPRGYKDASAGVEPVEYAQQWEDAFDGPDLIVSELYSNASYPSYGDRSAFAVATIVCNIGTQPASYVSFTNQHPVTIQNLYRLKGDRFEQLGLSWATNEFAALAGAYCGQCQPPNTTQQLGVGCSTVSSGAINGLQNQMGPRSQVNAHTGYFPYPPMASTEPKGILDRRVHVANEDIDPDLNPDAQYYVEAQFIAPDDAMAGLADNNASYRQVLFTGPFAGNYRMVPIGQTQVEQAAVRAWKDFDPEVVETDIRAPGEGLFILAARAVALDDGRWLYSYALQNLNSDRSAGAFSLPLPSEADVTDVGFHDVDYHSGEPFDGTDWNVDIAGGSLVWSTDSHNADPDANALRFGTVFSFWFESAVEPSSTLATVRLFKPGSPAMVSAQTIGPALYHREIEADTQPSYRRGRR